MLKKSKGFTLVELIIVIVIIGILASVTVIGYTSQTAKARDNSAFVGLSEAVKGANVCIANGDNLTAVTQPATPDPNLVSGVTVCASSTAVTGNWPTLSSIGGNWKYVNFTATAPTGAGATTNSITAAGVISVSGASNAAAIATTDHGVKCALSGCTKYNF